MRSDAPQCASGGGCTSDSERLAQWRNLGVDQFRRDCEGARLPALCCLCCQGGVGAAPSSVASWSSGGVVPSWRGGPVVAGTDAADSTPRFRLFGVGPPRVTCLPTRVGGCLFTTHVSGHQHPPPRSFDHSRTCTLPPQSPPLASRFRYCPASPLFPLPTP